MVDLMNAAAMLPQTAYYAEPAGFSAYGDPSFGAPVAFRCRYETGIVIGRGPGGETPVYGDVLVSAVEISAGARLWPPGADQTKADESVKPDKVRSAQTPGGYQLWEIHI